MSLVLIQRTPRPFQELPGEERPLYTYKTKLKREKEVEVEVLRKYLYACTANFEIGLAVQLGAH